MITDDRRSFLDELNESFAVLRDNRALWEAELAERELWDATGGDTPAY